MRKDGSETLIGSSVGVEKIEQYHAPQWQTDPDKISLPFEKEHEAESDWMFDLSVAINNQIDRLRDIQENMWDAHSAVTHSKERPEFKKAFGKLKRAIKRAEREMVKGMKLPEPGSSE